MEDRYKTAPLKNCAALFLYNNAKEQKRKTDGGSVRLNRVYFVFDSVQRKGAILFALVLSMFQLLNVIEGSKYL